MGYWGSPIFRTYPNYICFIQVCFWHVLATKAGFTVRNWMPKIYRYLNKDQRKKLAEATKMLEVTTKKRNAEGKLVVS